MYLYKFTILFISTIVRLICNMDFVVNILSQTNLYLWWCIIQWITWNYLILLYTYVQISGRYYKIFTLDHFVAGGLIASQPHRLTWLFFRVFCTSFPFDSIRINIRLNEHKNSKVRRLGVFHRNIWSDLREEIWLKNMF